MVYKLLQENPWFGRAVTLAVSYHLFIFVSNVCCLTFALLCFSSFDKENNNNELTSSLNWIKKSSAAFQIQMCFQPSDR